MIIKKRKQNTLWLITFILVISLFSSLNKANIMIFAHDVYENIFRISPGFSSARNLVDKGGDSEFQSMLTKSLNILSNSGNILRYVLNESKKDLEQIKIEIKFKDYRKILDDRQDAIERGFLINPKEVNAIIKFREDSFKAKVRLKGDLGDHWQSKHRFSLRVNLKAGKTILGMRSFSIHKPRARQHPYDQAFQNLLRSSGNLSTAFGYARVELNNESWGVMHLEEQLTKEFLEKQKRKEALIFRFSDDLLWKNYNKSTNDFYQYYKLSDSSLFATVYGAKRYFQQDHFRKVYTYILEERLKDEHIHLYDLEQHIKLFAASLAWNNFHVLSDHNTKYYFNPYTLKLNPISGDQGLILKAGPDFFQNLRSYPFSPNYVQTLMSLDQDLNDYILPDAFKSLVYSDDMFNQFSEIFPLDQPKSTEVLKSNINFMLKNMDQIFESLNDNLKELNQKISEPPTNKQSKDLLSHIQIRHYDDGRLKLFNLLPDTILIEDVYFDGNPIGLSNIALPGYNEKDNLTIQTSLKGLLDNKIQINTRYKGQSRVHLNGPSLLQDKIINPLIQDNASSLPFIYLTDEGIYKIKKGKWKVYEPIYINGTLHVEAGANLDFDKGSYLVLKGNIQVQGKVNEKVTFGSSNYDWKGIYILSNDKEESLIENMIVQNTQATEAGILKLTGGFTIYDSDITIKNLLVDSTDAEDALNIVNSNINISGLRIVNAVSDGLDCDFCEGSITHSSAENINGDAFDFSGSKLDMFGIDVKDVRDKAFSVGEKSLAAINKASAVNVGVALAAKDSSKIYAQTLEVKDFKLHAAMTYQKKPIFGKDSSIIIEKSNIEGTSAFKRQFGSTLLVDGIPITESEVSVTELYTEGIMKK